MTVFVLPRLRCITTLAPDRTDASDGRVTTAWDEFCINLLRAANEAATEPGSNLRLCSPMQSPQKLHGLLAQQGSNDQQELASSAVLQAYPIFMCFDKKIMPFRKMLMAGASRKLS